MANDSEPVWNRILHELLEFRRDVDEKFVAVNQRVDGFRGEMLTNFDAVFKRLDTVIADLQERVTQLESKFHDA